MDSVQLSARLRFWIFCREECRMTTKIPTKAASERHKRASLGVRAQANTAPETACACSGDHAVSGDPGAGLERSVWLRPPSLSWTPPPIQLPVPFRRWVELASGRRVELTNAQRAVWGWLYPCCPSAHLMKAAFGQRTPRPTTQVVWSKTAE